MKTKLKELQNVIRKACPELMELSFGCVVHLRNHPWRNYICLGKSEDYYDYVYTKNDDERASHYLSERNGSKVERVLGHPITLEHVLKVLENHENWEYDGEQFWEIIKDDTSCHCHPDYISRSYISRSFCQWQLTKPLSQQKEEVINFLYKLLCKDKHVNT